MHTAQPGEGEIPLDYPIDPDGPDYIDGYKEVYASVLLGGCGDARNFFATIMDAANPERCPEPDDMLLLRVTLNDLAPEAITRMYVCLHLLQQLADELPDDDDLDLDDVPEDVDIRAIFLWHIYNGATLCSSTYKVLQSVLKVIVAESEPILHNVFASKETWTRSRMLHAAGWTAS